MLLRGDSVEQIRMLGDCTIDAVITDPPYGLTNHKPSTVSDAITRWASGDRSYTPTGAGFMGKSWDGFVPPPAVWDECYRVLKPGGHLLAFAGSRTSDLMGISVRMAGFEIRDTIAWIYGSGFPKSLDVSKAIDKAAGAQREVVGSRTLGGTAASEGHRGRASVAAEGKSSAGLTVTVDVTVPATDDAKRWQGWGTALKPALEPIIVARKPLEGTVAQNVTKHGTGAVNIDACRIGMEGGTTRDKQAECSSSGWRTGHSKEKINAGRWPANVIIDDYAETIIDEQANAARFFYVAKPSRAERNAGFKGLPEHDQENAVTEHKGSRSKPRANFHPTVKPLTLMRYLARLVTQPGGTILDPFLGSGTTACAAILEGYQWIGCELTEEYWPIIEARTTWATQQTSQSPQQLTLTDYEGNA